MQNKIKSVTVSYPETDELKDELQLRYAKVLAKILVNMPPERLKEITNSY